MTLLLIDSASLWYRAYYGMPDTLVSPTGQPVNAIRGFLDMTARLINLYNPKSPNYMSGYSVNSPYYQATTGNNPKNPSKNYIIEEEDGEEEN